MQFYKYFFLVNIASLLFYFSNPVHGSSDIASIQIVGTGITPSAALDNALTNAVRTVAGQMIITERKVINDDLLEKMTSYSDGVVKTYEVISESNKQGIYKVTINAIVNKEKVTSYLNQSTTDGKINGQGIYGYAVTAKNKVSSKKNLIEDYKKKLLTSGYEIQLGEITVPSNGNTEILVDFTVSLKREYIDNFKKTFELAGIGSDNWRECDSNYLSFLCFGRGKFAFTVDSNFAQYFDEYPTEPEIQLMFKDRAGKTIITRCIGPYDSFVSPPKYNSHSAIIFYTYAITTTSAIQLSNDELNLFKDVKNISAILSCDDSK
jgi:hypothetical protein